MEEGRTETHPTRALQVVDAFLVWLAFWLAALLRDPVREALGKGAMGDVGLGAMMPLLFVVIPLTPVVLDWAGFYRDSPRKIRFGS